MELFKHFWIFFIVVTTVNALILRSRSKKFIARDPELEKGYSDIFKGYLMIANIPWIIMAIGNSTGLTDSIFDYFNPSAMNPIVLAFHGYIILLYIAGAYWIYYKDGAAFLEKHPGLVAARGLNGPVNVTARQIKRYYPFFMLIGIGVLVFMWTMPLMPFK